MVFHCSTLAGQIPGPGVWEHPRRIAVGGALSEAQLRLMDVVPLKRQAFVRPSSYNRHMSFDDYKVVLYRQDDGSWVAEIPAAGAATH